MDAHAANVLSAQIMAYGSVCASTQVLVSAVLRKELSKILTVCPVMLYSIQNCGKTGKRIARFTLSESGLPVHPI
jgi:hypothetical protein